MLKNVVAISLKPRRIYEPFRISKRLIVAKSAKANQMNDFNKLEKIKILIEDLNVSRLSAEIIIYKNPRILKLDHTEIKNVIEMIKKLGLPKNCICENPKIFSLLPKPLQQYWNIYIECGFPQITVNLLSNYLTITRKYKIKELKEKKLIPLNHNVLDCLMKCFEDWPISRTNLPSVEQEDCSLLELRMIVLQRYLELIMDINQDQFNKALKSYPRIKHKSFKSIKMSLEVLQDVILLPVSKIKSNLFLLYSDSENLLQLVYTLKKLAGIEIREILRAHPILCNTNYETFVATAEVLKQYNIGDKAQRKCFEIYSLGTETVKKRLHEAHQISELRALIDHPRALRLIFYRNNAIKRLNDLNATSKKCTSLHILSCSTSHYKAYEKSPGDRTKGKDLVLGLANVMNKSPNHLKRILRRHPFWINIPIVQSKSVYTNLSKYFSTDDIFPNSCILFYPWNDILKIYKLLKSNKLSCLVKSEGFPALIEHVNVKTLTDLQILSLILYLLEKRHYFSGNGIWHDDSLPEIVSQDKCVNVC